MTRRIRTILPQCRTVNCTSSSSSIRARDEDIPEDPEDTDEPTNPDVPPEEDPIPPEEDPIPPEEDPIPPDDPPTEYDSCIEKYVGPGKECLRSGIIRRYCAYPTGVKDSIPDSCPSEFLGNPFCGCDNLTATCCYEQEISSSSSSSNSSSSSDSLAEVCPYVSDPDSGLYPEIEWCVLNITYQTYTVPDRIKIYGNCDCIEKGRLIFDSCCVGTIIPALMDVFVHPDEFPLCIEVDADCSAGLDTSWYVTIDNFCFITEDNATITISGGNEDKCVVWESSSSSSSSSSNSSSSSSSSSSESNSSSSSFGGCTPSIVATLIYDASACASFQSGQPCEFETASSVGESNQLDRVSDSDPYVDVISGWNLSTAGIFLNAAGTCRFTSTITMDGNGCPVAGIYDLSGGGASSTICGIIGTIEITIV